MKKKGEVTLWFLVEAIAFVLIVYAAFELSTALSNGRIYEELNIAKDLALQINTLESIRGDTYIINNNLHGYSVAIDGNKIEVYEDPLDFVRGTYFFVPSETTKLNNRFNAPQQLIITKIDGQIQVSETIPTIT